MSQSVAYQPARDPLPDQEQKQAALSYLNEAWAVELAAELLRHARRSGDASAQVMLLISRDHGRRGMPVARAAE